MSAISALKAACAAGIRLGGDGDDLVLEAAAPPPAAVIDLLSRASLASWRAAAGAPTAGRPRTGRSSSTFVRA